MQKKATFESNVKKEHRFLLGQFKIKNWEFVTIFDGRTIYWYDYVGGTWFLDFKVSFKKELKYCFICGSALIYGLLRAFKDYKDDNHYVCCECIRIKTKHKLTIRTNYEEFLNAKEKKRADKRVCVSKTT